ncbi:hypothetical protein ORN12_02895 [Pantoea vagans]|uniref:hypothetical protein n=1 Tax=Pantoea vagans TaxID=470934 RepID=UPI0022503F51|nr:hypothetical protein [Pantoea vagans]MCX3307958.1 hypothetical protein [Pantoea vagans]
MLNLDLLMKNIPPMPSIKGQWRSFYLEPMLGSGERLTIMVAAISNDGQAIVKPAIRKEVIEAMYGFKSNAFLSMVEILCNSLRDHLLTNKSFEGWISPVTGVTAGSSREAASASVTGILRQAIALSSSLSTLNVEDSSQVTKKHRTEKDRWATQLMQAVLTKDPSRERYFNRSVTFTDGHRPAKIFYLSEKSALNTGKLVPANLNQLVIDNKAKISDLSMAKLHDDMFPRNRHELLVFRPPADDPRYTDKNILAIESAFLSLEDLADAYSVSVSAVYSVEHAVSKIIGIAA